MGDMGELFNAWRKTKQEKRASNREDSATLLREAGISFVERNGRAHLIVSGGIDFWPGTGLWIIRDLQTKRRKRRGVKHLINFVRATGAARSGS